MNISYINSLDKIFEDINLNGISVKKKKKPSDFNQRELKVGTKIEMEHTDDPKIAKQIAMDHMTEFENGYYDGLVKMEKELEKKNKKK